MFFYRKKIVFFTLIFGMYFVLQSQDKMCFLNNKCYSPKKGEIITDSSKTGIIKILLIKEDSCLFWYKDFYTKQIVEGSYLIKGYSIDSSFIENEYGDIEYYGQDTSSIMIQNFDWMFFDFDGKPIATPHNINTN